MSKARRRTRSTGFYRVVLESFAEKVRTLLAFARLRADVTEILEMRSADDLLVAVGDQTSHLVRRLDDAVGAMRMRILELQDLDNEGRLGKAFLTSSLEGLRELAERTLRMPDEHLPAARARRGQGPDQRVRLERPPMRSSGRRRCALPATLAGHSRLASVLLRHCRAEPHPERR